MVLSHCNRSVSLEGSKGVGFGVTNGPAAGCGVWILAMSDSNVFDRVINLLTMMENRG